MAYVRRSITSDVGSIRTVTNDGGGFGSGGGDIFGPINMNGNSICGLPAIPPGDSCATSKSYVDSIAAGLDPKESVRYVTIANIADLTNQAVVEAALDDVGAADPNIVPDDRILVKDQADARFNGIYTWQVGGLVRASDMDGSPGNEVSSGNYTFVENGDTLAQTGWVLGGDGQLTLGVDDLDWFLFSARPSGNNVGGGSEVFRDITNGQTLNFRTLVAGTDISLVQAADTITINNTGGGVTLASAGAGESLVNDGVGPALATKSLFPGTNISLVSDANTVTINNTGNSFGGTVRFNDTVSAPQVGFGYAANVQVVVPFNEITTSDASIILAANAVTLNTAGWYNISASITLGQEPNDAQVILSQNGTAIRATILKCDEDTIPGVLPTYHATIQDTVQNVAGDVYRLLIVSENPGSIGVGTINNVNWELIYNYSYLQFIFLESPIHNTY